MTRARSRFNLFHYGRWVQVCIDDQLPYYGGRLLMLQSIDQQTFWASLLEKAYAKLYGSYEALSGGICCDSLTDLSGRYPECTSICLTPILTSGGISETILLRPEEDENANERSNYSTKELYDILARAVQRQALICTGIWVRKRMS